MHIDTYDEEFDECGSADLAELIIANSHNGLLSVVTAIGEKENLEFRVTTIDFEELLEAVSGHARQLGMLRA